MQIFVSKSDFEQKFLSDLAVSLQGGDLPRARRLLFGESYLTANEVSLETALALRWGLPVDIMSSSFQPAEVCFMHACALQGFANFAREVLEAKHPQSVGDVQISSKVDWMDFLCTSWTGWDFQKQHLLDIVLAFGGVNDRPGFFAIALDYIPREVLKAKLDKQSAEPTEVSEHWSAIQTCGLQIMKERRTFKKR